MKKFCITVSLILLITAIFELNVEYGYYQVLRWAVMICAGLLAVLFKDKNTTLFIIFCIITILFNPIIPIYFDRNTWRIIDGITGLLFLVPIIKKFKL